MTQEKYPCPACGHKTLDEIADYDICPVCYWEDDMLVDGKEDVCSPSNYGQLLSEAQSNYIIFGACKREYLDKVRPPTKDETPSKDWRILAKAQEILNHRKTNDG